MIRRHRICVQATQILFVTILYITAHHRVLCAAPAPVDYLVPPPPPPPPSPQPPATHLNLARPSNPSTSESRTVPQYGGVSSQTLQKAADDPGFISRMARWFGFSNQNYSQDQQTSAASTNNQLYYYPRPQQQLGTGIKEPCNLCNKYPWVPMMHNSVHYPWDPSKQNQLAGNAANGYVRNNYGNIPPVPQIQHAASNVKQRAVQFHYHPPAPPITSQVASTGQQSPQIQYSTGPFLPIPIPNLSNSAQPPLYNAQPFHQPSSALPPQYNAQPFHQPSPATSKPPPQQQLPFTEAAHFSDSIASAHSEIHLDAVIPTQIPPSIQNRDPSFEIIKSHQLADYISSVEYPASFVQTQSFDVRSGSSTVATNQPADNRPAVNTGRYQHVTLSPHLNQHIPASQILTEPGSFIVDNQYQTQQQQHQQQSTLHSEVYEKSTLVYEPQFTGNVQGYEFDNYASASVQNSSIVANGNYDTWTLESNDYLYATTTPEVYSSTEVETTTTFKPDVYPTTEPQQNNDVEFIASVQTNNQNAKSQYTTRLWPQRSRERETPKRLLDAPIQHISGNLGSPRPFTRDPSDLGLRVVAKNHKFAEQAHFQQTPQAVYHASPTPTSTYSSIDASGQFAGMSPPSLPTPANKHNFIPFTTKNQPRPFESTRDGMPTKPPPTSSFSTWTHTQNTDLHTAAETMLVNVKSELNPATSTSPKPRTTKYLTKILASNLRELLQREHTPPTKLKHSPNSLNFDLHALQKNIDDWTEQEYTSLSHRPSTPTILGRSKHIPKEYLLSTAITSTATVKPQRQSKTTKGFLDTSELPAFINSLEPLYDREGAKRFQYTSINGNHLQDNYDAHEVPNYKTTSVKPPTTTTSTTNKPLYQIDVVNQEPEELWRKAKVSISPKTKEKVYVVTPQPRFFPQRQVSTTTATTERPYNGLGSGFKSPRFLVRPTPGNVTASNLLKLLGTSENSRHTLDTSQEYNRNSFFIPDLIGLRGLTAYVPAEPVEIIDGNSKVLTIVKPPNNLEKTTPKTTPQNIMDLTKDRYTASKKKPNVEPSPR